MPTDITRRDVLRSAAAFAAGAWIGAAADVTQAGPYDDAVLAPGEPPTPQPGSFTLAVLPDTQNYSEKFPQHYTAQTQWIVEQQQRRNIACVLHLGDVTNHNIAPEWENAVASMKVLEGHVPYVIVPGNHDYGARGGCENRQSGLNEYFPVSQFKQQPHFGGVYDREPDQSVNNFALLSAGGRDLLILGLEFGPRKDVVRWANDVVASHRDRQVILITHAYMYYDDTRYDWAKYGKQQTWNPHDYPVARATGDDVADGQELWDQLVSRHDNFLMTLNGHVLRDGLGRISTRNSAGHPVHQMLVNFQMKPEGGDGWLRLLEFRPDGRTVQVYDYSPVRRERNESRQNQFLLNYPS